MPSKAPIPYFGVPPRTYDPRYLSDITRAFAQYIQQDRNPGEGRYTTAVYTDLADNDQGLVPGTLFEQDGFVKVTKTHAPHLAGLTATTSVGDVSVVIS